MTLLALTLVLAASPGQTPAPPPDSSPGLPAVPVIREDPSLLGHTEPPSTVAAQDEGSQSLGFVLFKMLLGLGVTVGLIYITLAYLARRLSQFPAMKGKLLRVAERLPLEPRRTLFVVEAAGEFLLVAASESGTTLLAKLEAEKVRAELAKAGAAHAASPKPFWLRLLEKRQTPRDP